MKFRVNIGLYETHFQPLALKLRGISLEYFLSHPTGHSSLALAHQASLPLGLCMWSSMQTCGPMLFLLPLGYHLPCASCSHVIF